jgi:hypothetical protein
MMILCYLFLSINKIVKEDFLRQLQDQGSDCQNCNDGREAAVVCKECNKRLCRDCDRTVHEPPTMKSHTRTPFTNNKYVIFIHSLSLLAYPYADGECSLTVP